MVKLLSRLLLLTIFVLLAAGPAGAAIDPAEVPATVTFKVMLSAFSDDGKLTKIETGQMVVSATGAVQGTYPVGAGGWLDFTVPTATTTTWALSTTVLGAATTRNFEAKVVDNYLYISNLDRDRRNVDYYELGTDAYIYAIEYFQDRLYITNQGDPTGAILGELKTGDKVGSASRSLPDAKPVVQQAGQYRIKYDEYWSLVQEGFNWHYARSGEVPFTVDGAGTASGSGSITEELVYLFTECRIAGSTPVAVTVAGTVGDKLILELTEETPEYMLHWDCINMPGMDTPAGGETHHRSLEFPLQNGASVVEDYNDGMFAGQAKWTLLFGGTADAPVDTPGGFEDDFGAPDPNEVVGGVLTRVEDLPSPAKVSQEWNIALEDAVKRGQSFEDNRASGYSAGAGSLTSAGAGSIKPAGTTPGVVFQWIYAGDKAPDEWLLPLDSSGTLPNGIAYQTLTDLTDAGASIMAIIRTFPPEFLIALAKGAHTLNYWLQDADGAKSNTRTETITID